jgi:hypothetical protein
MPNLLNGTSPELISPIKTNAFVRFSVLTTVLTWSHFLPFFCLFGGILAPGVYGMGNGKLKIKK